MTMTTEKLKVGITQKMVFGALGNFGNPETGPFWWSKEDQEKYKFDLLGREKTVGMVVAELRQTLNKHGVNSKGSKPDLIKRKRCNMHRPPIPIKRWCRK